MMLKMMTARFLWSYIYGRKLAVINGANIERVADDNNIDEN